jgi:RHS repeat-associated protein
LINAALQLAEKYAYDAYGNMLPGAGLTTDPATALTSILYSGEKTDPTGLQYLRARYYDPAIRRFTRLDPAAGNVQDPVTLHKYLYAGGDPILSTDPTGLFSIVGSIAASSIGSMINSITAQTGQAVGASLGFNVTVDPIDIILSRDIGILPESFYDAIDAAIDFAFEHGNEILVGASLAVVGIAVNPQQLKLFDRLSFYNKKVASLISPGKIVAKLSREASEHYRAIARDIWQSRTGRRAIWDGMEVHHRIPLEWAHIFPNADPNRAANLVAMKQADHKLVTKAWGDFGRSLGGRTATQGEVLRQALHIDRDYGNVMKFLPPGA